MVDDDLLDLSSPPNLQKEKSSVKVRIEDGIKVKKEVMVSPEEQEIIAEVDS